MKLLELFRRERTPAAAREAQDRVEKMVADSFRLLSQLCTRMADYVEAQRLARAGYEKQGKFLRRVEPTQEPSAPKR